MPRTLARISRSDTALKSPRPRSERAPAPLRAPAVEKTAPVDRVEVKRGGTDGKAFVQAALVDLAARVAKGETVRVVFDIDDTLSDSRVRTLTIAKAWDQANGTHHFDRLTVAQVASSGLDTARALGLPWPAEKAFAEHWEQAFWDGASFVHDAPIAEVVALAKQARSLGAEVVFLTGRVQALENDTIAQLQRFGLEASHRSVVSKPGLGTRTVPFKAEWLAKSEADGKPVAFFFTESRRDIAGIQAAAVKAPSVLLDSPFGGSDGVAKDTPIYPRAV